MKKAMKRKSLGCLLLLVGFVLLVTLAASAYMLAYSLKPSPNKGRNYPMIYHRLFADYPATRPWIDSLRRVHALRDTFIALPDGRRHALLIRARRPTGRTALLVHGYTDCAVSMLHLGYLYHHTLGYNLLLPDLYGHGRSDGDAARMGWKDRLDVLRWAQIADSLYRDSTGHAEIVVHGISMGAATTMAVSGEDTLAYVRAFVEDCGYTSVRDEFTAQLDAQFGLPPFPLISVTSALCRVKYGWWFGEADMLSAVARCHKPMLFIHGDCDTFVPTAMVYQLYRAKPGAKQLFIGRGSVHARTYYDHPQQYARALSWFLQQAM